MLISNNKGVRIKKTSFALSIGLSMFLLASMLLAGNGFIPIGSITRQPTSAYAQEANNVTTATSAHSSTASTDTNNTSSSIELSPQPVLQERTTTISQTPINQTHISAAFTGTGTLTIPNTTETINFTANGSALISLVTHSTQAKETIITEEGETATATFYEILKINPAADGDGKGLTMAVIQTDSTGKLAPLNGTILAGIINLQSNVDNTVTLWKWESGIDNNVSNAATSTQEQSLNTTS